MLHELQWDDEFPQDPSICYLNHAAVAPWPKRAADAVTAFAQENITRGAEDYPRWIQLEHRLRGQFQTLLNAPSKGDIALVKNTSEALSLVAMGLDWVAGDEILISDQEFPSNRIPWQALEGRGVIVRQVSLDGDNPEAALIAAMGPATRLLSISSVQYASGLRMDLARLGRACRERNILFCVDAIQSLGALPFDVQAIDCDFAMADGHKWLLGPEGLGVFYCRRDARDRLKLLQYGWHMVEAMGDYDREDWMPASTARRFEPGSPNTLAQHALSASLELLLEVGEQRIQEALQQRTAYLLQSLGRLPGVRILSPAAPERRAGIVTFRIEGCDTNQLFAQLKDAGVICAARGGGIRWSPHFYTSQEVLDRALDTLRTILTQRRD
ncbi:MAG TPA: aminotransferase class V-fold PLP-dependent enzyme [Candidatus Pseudomonas excrementavium]|uniref:aminotransferase class V-fold PLP-dependent enzyme n=1 Tax=Halopseudomonas bauzanensis TaxID=653930 RepID=UPI001C398252|nr:aminotransferase class V-fold PLP-dependent enzyme [Halopseudomonas bauzanensis]HIZ49680.1 aminotransferase class V-fold PLP-dependent enzyme [Candidatus Pseudomonas excrementavium]